MKCLCITAPFYTCKEFESYYFPLGLGYIASFLKKEGHICYLYNTTPLSKKDLDIIINKNKYDLVLISVSTNNRGSALKISKKIKEINPKIFVIWGGHYPSEKGKEIMEEYSCVDFIVKKRGEKTILKLIKCIENNKFEEIINIPNLIFRKNKKIIQTKTSMDFIHINSLPTPSYESLSFDLSSVNYMIFPLEFSRGCTLKCKFCSITDYFKHYEKRDPKKIIKDIKKIQSLFQYKKNGEKRELFFDVIDPTVNLDKKHLISVCKEIINNNLNIKFLCQARIDLMDLETIKILKKAGCSLIYYGVQSGSKKIRENMGIKISNKKIEEIVSLTKKNNLKMRLYWILGFPGETYKNLFETIKFSIKLKQENICSLLSIYPETEIYKMALRKKIINTNFFKKNPQDCLYPTKIPRSFLKIIRNLMMLQSDSFIISYKFFWRSVLESINYRKYKKIYN